MAVPMVAATAALVKKLNPDLTAADVIRLIKQTAQRPAGAGWNPDLGWGILSAGAALSVAQRLDRRPPQSVIAKPPTRTHRRAIRLRWSGKDFAPPSVLLTGLARYELWESVNAGRYRRVYSGRSKSKLVRLRPGWRLSCRVHGRPYQGGFQTTGQCSYGLGYPAGSGRCPVEYRLR